MRLRTFVYNIKRNRAFFIFQETKTLITFFSGSNFSSSRKRIHPWNTSNTSGNVTETAKEFLLLFQMKAFVLFREMESDEKYFIKFWEATLLFLKMKQDFLH